MLQGRGTNRSTRNVLSPEPVQVSNGSNSPDIVMISDEMNDSIEETLMS